MTSKDEKLERVGKKRRQRVGVVVSAKMNKTISVRVTRRVPHPVYKKIINWRSVFKAHDEKNVAKEGNRVRIVETKPISKTKRWRLAEVLGS